VLNYAVNAADYQQFSAAEAVAGGSILISS